MPGPVRQGRTFLLQSRTIPILSLLRRVQNAASGGSAYHSNVPVIRLSHSIGLRALVEAMDGRPYVHLVALRPFTHEALTAMIQGLASQLQGPPKQLRLTVLDPCFNQSLEWRTKASRSGRALRQTLTHAARAVRLPRFTYDYLQLTEDSLHCVLDSIQSRQPQHSGVTESLVIITVFGLSRVPDTPALSPNPRPTLMRWIQRARPDLLICQETAADLESQSLVPRLQGSLDFYGPLIDMHDAFLELACTQQPRLPPSKERAPQGAAEGRPDAAQAHGTEESQPAEGAGAARQLTVSLPGGHQSLSAAGRGVRLDQRAGGDPCAVQTASSGKRGGGPAEATSVPQGRQSAQLPRGEAQLPADVASQVYKFEKGMMGPYINLTLSLSSIQAVQSLNLPGWKALLSSHGLAEEPIPATLQGPLHQLLHGLPRELSFHLEGGAVAVCWKGQPLYLTSLWTSNMLALH